MKILRFELALGLVKTGQYSAMELAGFLFWEVVQEKKGKKCCLAQFVCIVQ